MAQYTLIREASHSYFHIFSTKWQLRTLSCHACQVAADICPTDVGDYGEPRERRNELQSPLPHRDSRYRSYIWGIPGVNVLAAMRDWR